MSDQHQPDHPAEPDERPTRPLSGQPEAGEPPAETAASEQPPPPAAASVPPGPPPLEYRQPAPGQPGYPPPGAPGTRRRWWALGGRRWARPVSYIAVGLAALLLGSVLGAAVMRVVDRQHVGHYRGDDRRHHWRYDAPPTPHSRRSWRN